MTVKRHLNFSLRLELRNAVGAELGVTAIANANRRERELYDPEFRLQYKDGKFSDGATPAMSWAFFVQAPAIDTATNQIHFHVQSLLLFHPLLVAKHRNSLQLNPNRLP